MNHRTILKHYMAQNCFANHAFILVFYAISWFSEKQYFLIRCFWFPLLSQVKCSSYTKLFTFSNLISVTKICPFAKSLQNFHLASLNQLSIVNDGAASFICY